MAEKIEAASLFPSKVIPRRVLRRQEPAAPSWAPLTIGSVLLCIDPSIVKCGWAIVRNTYPNPERIDSGVLQPIERPTLHRYDHLARLIWQRIDLAGENGTPPTDALVEMPAGGNGWERGGTLMVYGGAVGICGCACLGRGLDVQRVRVDEWKGGSKKAATIRYVRHAFNYEPRDDNEADALGLGLWLCSKTRRPNP